MSWEETLATWAKQPSDTEGTKADNAERIIRDALKSDAALSKYNIRVFAQGSYKANTNVRLESDVDICILCDHTYYYDLTFSDITPDSLGGEAVTLEYPQFRNMVETTLVNRFGKSGVTRGNKAFDVHANSYRLDADVVTAFELRRYNKRGADGRVTFEQGIAFLPDRGISRIDNWPEQTYANGVRKNNQTSQRYKRAIRILKRLRNWLQENGVREANDIGSFVIESVLWNVPDERFDRQAYLDLMRAVLAYAFNNTMKDEDCAEWGEVNELKYLFRGTPGLRARVHGFLDAAWNALGLS